MKIAILLACLLIFFICSCSSIPKKSNDNGRMEKVIESVIQGDYNHALKLLDLFPKKQMLFYRVKGRNSKLFMTHFPKYALFDYIEKIKGWVNSVNEDCKNIPEETSDEIEYKKECYNEKVRKFIATGDYDESSAFHYSRYASFWDNRCDSSGSRLEQNGECSPLGCIKVPSKSIYSREEFYMSCGGNAFVNYLVNSNLRRLEEKLDKVRMDEHKQSKAKEKEEEISKEKYENSPEGISKRACEYLDQINFAKKIIKKERAAGKISGFIDKNRIYEAGKIIQNYTEYLDEKKRAYKQKTGKSLNLKKCK